MKYLYDHLEWLLFILPLFCLLMAKRAKKRYNRIKNTGKLPDIFAAQRSRRLWHIGATVVIITIVCCLLFGCTSMYKYSNDPLKRTHNNRASHHLTYSQTINFYDSLSRRVDTDHYSPGK